MTLVERLRERRDYWRKRLEAASGNAVFVTQRDVDDVDEAADRLEALEGDYAEATQLWAKHGDEADAFADLLREAVDYGGAWTVEQWRFWTERAEEATTDRTKRLTTPVTASQIPVEESEK